MFRKEQYYLVDFGDGEKLESFQGQLVLRPAPAAIGLGKMIASRNGALQFKKMGSAGKWHGSAPEDWTVRHGSIRLNLKPTPFGHVGVFPEQAANWHWIEELPLNLHGMCAINLFAHTGGTTIALAQRGASVVHVDSAKNIVQWARQNAQLSGVADAPIRWIVDDAMTFLRRESKRGNRYDFIVADPPSYGHGLRKTDWRFERDLHPLLAHLSELASERLMGILISCHTQGYDDDCLARDVQDYFNFEDCNQIEHGPMSLIQIENQRALACGHFLRWRYQGGV